MALPMLQRSWAKIKQVDDVFFFFTWFHVAKAFRDAYRLMIMARSRKRFIH